MLQKFEPQKIQLALVCGNNYIGILADLNNSEIEPWLLLLHFLVEIFDYYVLNFNPSIFAVNTRLSVHFDLDAFNSPLGTGDLKPGQPEDEAEACAETCIFHLRDQLEVGPMCVQQGLLGEDKDVLLRLREGGLLGQERGEGLSEN
jgi:hypothetical protein